MHTAKVLVNIKVITMIPVILVLLLPCTVADYSFTLEAEARVEQYGLQSRVINRPMASGGKTVHLQHGNFVGNDFCLPGKGEVIVEDVRYSNMEGSDKVLVLLDEEMIGNFTTVDHTGDEDMWNVFISTGPVGSRLLLEEGEHVLRFFMQSSNVGAEIDNARIQVSGVPCSDVGNSFFRCQSG